MKLTLVQKILLFALYGLIVLMVIFSFQATKNLGKAGYDQCVQKKCTERGDAFCQKFRELNNCCQGAGGTMAVSDNNYVCIFD